MWSYFEKKSMPYNLRDGSKLVLPKTKSSPYGINSLQFRRSLLWNNLAVSLKNCQSLNKFKLELKIWEILIVLAQCVVKAYFKDYFRLLLILLFTILVCKFLWVSSE